MKKGWSIVLTIVLIAILLGTVSIVVGHLTGGNLDRIYSVLDARYHLAELQQAYTQYAVDLFDAVVSAWNAV